MSGFCKSGHNWSKLWLLNFNTTKCSVMHLGRNDRATYTLFNLATNSNTLLQPTTEQKDLGVWTTPSMNFSVHCQKAASKANQALGMIKRNFKYMSKSSLMILYKTFVRPHLEYCAPIWNPRYCKDIDTLEKVQRRATKLVPSISTLSYESRLNQLQLHSLYCRRQRSDLIEVYKIMNNQYLTNPDNIFTRAPGSTTRGHTLKLFKPRVNTTVRQHFFNSRVITYWNNLPQDVISAKSTSAFKFKLDNYWNKLRYGHNQRPMAY